MSTREVRQVGDEILKKKSKDVLELTDRLKELIADMKETMTEKGGCGLAAVQVGVLRNIFIAQPDDKGPIYTFINPKITWMSDEKEDGLEGCLSVDGKKGVVNRAKKIKLKAMDINMKESEYELEDFFARIVQHECDHLEGSIYTEKLNGKLYDRDEKVPGFDEDEEEENNKKSDQ